MTDLSLASAPTRPAAGRQPLPAPLVLLAFAVAGIALGALDRPAALPEPNLVLLLRFMAALKGMAALGGAALLLWRQRRALTAPLPARLALAYAAGLALMALAPGLIWSLAHVAIGALAFHVGLILFAVAALRDDTGLSDVLPVGPRRRS